MARKIQVEIVGDARSLERAFGRASKSGDKFHRKMSAIGRGIGVGIGGGILAFGFAMKRGFSELADAQKVAAQTGAVLRSTGGIANVSAKHVDKMASALSRMSGIDDEAIAAGENMLLTFTNVRNGVKKGDKIFDRATETILDMSVALGRDLPDVAIMVGKALNDTEVNAKGTITGWSALRRVGVKVSSAMMEQAAAFIKAGKPMEAQKLLLQELQTEFGGSARAYGKTMPGALGKLRNAFDEVAAAFAKGFLPLINRVANFLTKKLADPAFVARVEKLGRLIGDKLYKGFLSISTWFQNHWGQIQEGFRTAGHILARIHRLLKKIADVAPNPGSLLALLAGGLLALKGKKMLGGLGGGGGITKGGKGGGKIGPKGAGRVGGFGFVTPTMLEGGSGGGVTRIDDFEGLKRLARQGKLSARVLRKADRYLNDKQMAILWRLMAKGRGKHLRTYPRAHGGPVMPGVAYRVGERGPETFVPGSSGTIIPNGGGGGDVVLMLDGREIARASLSHLQRMSKGGSSSTRGRLGGQRLALT